MFKTEILPVLLALAFVVAITSISIAIVGPGR